MCQADAAGESSEGLLLSAVNSRRELQSHRELGDKSAGSQQAQLAPFLAAPTCVRAETGGAWEARDVTPRRGGGAVGTAVQHRGAGPAARDPVREAGARGKVSGAGTRRVRGRGGAGPGPGCGRPAKL